MARTCLIVSPHFPPATLAGVHRARHLSKYLPAHGWRPIIICLDPSKYIEPNDPALAALVPSSVELIRTSALPVSLTRLFGVGDIGIRGYHQFARALKTAAVAHRPDAVMITGSPFYPMLLARMVRQSLGLPVVLDFQDPWVSAEGATRHPFSKGGLAHRLATVLEPHAVRQASFITSVSETQNQQMAGRYPWLDQERMAAIPIGGDPEDFEALRRDPPQSLSFQLISDKLNFCYVGTFLPRAGPIVRALFRAVATLKTRDPQLADRIRFVFVGTSNQPGGTILNTSHLVLPFAQDAGVAEMVEEFPGRVPFVEALSLLANAHAVLMLGSDEPHYTASKIYPGMMSGRPFLSIFHQASSAHEILANAGGGVAISFENLEQLEGKSDQVVEALRRLAQSPESFKPIVGSSYAAYTAHAVAGQFAEVLTRVCSPQ